MCRAAWQAKTYSILLTLACKHLDSHAAALTSYDYWVLTMGHDSLRLDRDDGSVFQNLSRGDDDGASKPF